MRHVWCDGVALDVTGNLITCNMKIEKVHNSSAKCETEKIRSYLKSGRCKNYSKTIMTFVTPVQTKPNKCKKTIIKHQTETPNFPVNKV